MPDSVEGFQYIMDRSKQSIEVPKGLEPRMREKGKEDFLQNVSYEIHASYQR